MPNDFAMAVDRLSRKAPTNWLVLACHVLRAVPVSAPMALVLRQMPATNNADLSFLLIDVLNKASGRLSWEAVSWTLDTVFAIHEQQHDKQGIELLWSGPSPGLEISARRIDQVLYDLIAAAKRDIQLITFAASNIQRLVSNLTAAAARGVAIRLILEFEQSSEGQLSYDAVRAFPPELLLLVEVFYWPLEKRERNKAGRPGKLHAKAAIIDDSVLISSANLTDDALNRNLELGVVFKDFDTVGSLRHHIDRLIFSSILVRRH